MYMVDFNFGLLFGTSGSHSQGMISVLQYYERFLHVIMGSDFLVSNIWADFTLALRVHNHSSS